MKQWARESSISGHPMFIYLVPEADANGMVTVKLKNLEYLLLAAGYQRVSENGVEI